LLYLFVLRGRGEQLDARTSSSSIVPDGAHPCEQAWIQKTGISMGELGRYRRKKTPKRLISWGFLDKLR
jgi:hypothetical protein